MFAADDLVRSVMANFALDAYRTDADVGEHLIDAHLVMRRDDVAGAPGVGQRQGFTLGLRRSAVGVDARRNKFDGTLIGPSSHSAGGHQNRFEIGIRADKVKSRSAHSPIDVHRMIIQEIDQNQRIDPQLTGEVA